MNINCDSSWCDDSVNPVMGCNGCEIVEVCSAHQKTKQNCKRVKSFPRSFNEVTLFPGRMAAYLELGDSGILSYRPDKPWLEGLPRLISINEMGDNLSKAVGFEYLELEIIDQVTSAEGMLHHWLWLTKQPGRMAKFSAWLGRLGRAWPPNLWATCDRHGGDWSAWPRKLQVREMPLVTAS